MSLPLVASALFATTMTAWADSSAQDDWSNGDLTQNFGPTSDSTDTVGSSWIQDDSDGKTMDSGAFGDPGEILWIHPNREESEDSVDY